MELKSNYLLAGGIAEVVMHPSSSTLPEAVLATTDESFSITLHHEGSSYSEVRGSTHGMYSVRHKLTLVGYMGGDMASEAAVQRVLQQGVVADVRLNSGESVRVGWSEKYGVAAPLRLVSSEILTGEKRLDFPLKTWVWESLDTTALI